MNIWLRVITMNLLVIALGLAQFQGGDRPMGAHNTVQVRGEIESSRTALGGLTVELRLKGMGMGESVTVAADGSFEFRAVPPGLQELRVSGPGGSVIHQELVNVIGPNQRLTIRLPEAPDANRSIDSSTVSMQQLRHKVSGPTRKAYEKGLAAARKGNNTEAAVHFRRAVELDPEFADGHDALGTAEARLGQLSESAEQFQKTIDLVPEHGNALTNLSVVLLKMKRIEEAGAVARRALKIVPTLAKLHYIVAASLLVQHTNDTEALSHLQKAAPEIPSAHLLASDLLAQAGRRQEAANQLTEYLRSASPDDEQRAKVEARLLQLQRAASPTQ